jgi:outer membrane lipoprotein carrier protein
MVVSPLLAQDSGEAKVSAEEVAKRVQAFYSQTKDYQSSFRQTYHDLAAGKKKVSVGRVYFKKPGKMRWDYKKANAKKPDKLYVSDGSSFWVYEYEFKQVFKQCLKDSQLPTSLSFLMGTGDLLDEFNVSFAKDSTKKTPRLRLVPKKPTSKYKELRFALDPETYQVVQTTIYDPYGNKNVIEFTRARVNKNLPDRGFDFKVPKGARVLNPQQKCK